MTVKNLPAHVQSAQLFRIDDNVTNPYTTWLGWNNAAKAAGKCNSHCAEGMDAHCPCLNYLTPTQIAELDAAGQMAQEEVVVDAGGKLTFELAPYASVNIRFPDASGQW